MLLSSLIWILGGASFSMRLWCELLSNNDILQCVIAVQSEIQSLKKDLSTEPVPSGGGDQGN